MVNHFFVNKKNSEKGTRFFGNLLGSGFILFKYGQNSGFGSP